MTEHSMLIEVVKYMKDEIHSAYHKSLFNLDSVSLSAIDFETLFGLYRSLANIRPAAYLPQDIMEMQDAVLKSVLKGSGITRHKDIPPLLMIEDVDLGIWKGDITLLEIDAIVNAANSKMLGCWIPQHTCIDNAIHTFSGVQLRAECQKRMKAQGHDEPTGSAVITPAFNLPSTYIVHTVGPIISSRLRHEDETLLASCYLSCLDLANWKQCKSIAFCCISTGEFRFPNERAAEIAIQSVREWVSQNPRSVIKQIVFNVFKERDHEIYKTLLT